MIPRRDLVFHLPGGGTRMATRIRYHGEMAPPIADLVNDLVGDGIPGPKGRRQCDR